MIIPNNQVFVVDSEILNIMTFYLILLRVGINKLPFVNHTGGAVICFTNKSLDTDTLETVIGEIERKLDLIATIRKKGLWAMELSDCDLGAASEGFFGAHSSIFFKSADDEFLIFIDKKNN